jgi:uncharacterized protein involved in outer membrane biogenesis
MKRGLLIGGGVLFVAIVGIVYFLFANLGGLIKEVVERVGSEATQASVTLDAADIDVTSGQGALNGLIVGNPAGFNTPSAFELGAISVSVDTASVTGDTVVIREVVIDGPKVTYELSQDGSNIDALKRNVDAFAAKHAAGGGEPEPAADGERGKKIIIERLTVRGGSVNVASNLLGDRSLGADLPAVEVRDIGKDSGGATPSEIAAVILDTLTGAATEAANSLDLSGLVEGGAAAVKEAAEDAAAGAADEAAGAVEGALDSLGGALGD